MPDNLALNIPWARNIPRATQIRQVLIVPHTMIAALNELVEHFTPDDYFRFMVKSSEVSQLLSEGGAAIMPLVLWRNRILCGPEVFMGGLLLGIAVPALIISPTWSPYDASISA